MFLRMLHAADYYQLQNRQLHIAMVYIAVSALAVSPRRGGYIKTEAFELILRNERRHRQSVTMAAVSECASVWVIIEMGQPVAPPRPCADVMH